MEHDPAELHSQIDKQAAKLHYPLSLSIDGTDHDSMTFADLLGSSPSATIEQVKQQYAEKVDAESLTYQNILLLLEKISSEFNQIDWEKIDYKLKEDKLIQIGKTLGEARKLAARCLVGQPCERKSSVSSQMSHIFDNGESEKEESVTAQSSEDEQPGTLARVPSVSRLGASDAEEDPKRQTAIKAQVPNKTTRWLLTILAGVMLIGGIVLGALSLPLGLGLLALSGGIAAALIGVMCCCYIGYSSYRVSQSTAKQLSPSVSAIQRSLSSHKLSNPDLAFSSPLATPKQEKHSLSMTSGEQLNIASNELPELPQRVKTI